ncbi:MAG TPA: M56 family metallopeptidase [Bryobacteraceae bacterium]|nr:M56 family metallopeptidase [Bryobacteraceae bacterium]
MLSQLMNHLWQSTVYAVGAGLLTLALRKNRAHVRFWLWLSASLKFLVPFALLMSLGSFVEWKPAPMARGAATVPNAVFEAAEPFAAALPAVPSKSNSHNWAGLLAASIWACGLSVIAGLRLRALLCIRAAVRESQSRRSPGCPIDIRFSRTLIEPGVVGVLHPVLMLPQNIEEHLTAPQLTAVMAHELAHIRRRDNLFSAIHMVVEALFWFHPLVWWIGTRLVEERERACDEEVLHQGNQPIDYAEGILNICKLYVESPLACVSGVTGSNLRKRVETILANRLSAQLGITRKLLLGSACVLALALPFVIGMLHAPLLRAQGKPIPKFEVTSVKPCRDPNSGGRNGGRNGSGAASAGRVDLPCRTVKDLISSAYLLYANGQNNPLSPMVVPIEGGPAWINSERYQVSATSASAVSPALLRGPMMQALLEDRFQLKIHREFREGPAYALTIAKGGTKLHPTQNGSCVDIMTTHPSALEPGQKICGSSRSKRSGPNLTWEVPGMTLDDYCKLLSFGLGRPVINQTDLQGLFDYKLMFAADESLPGLLNRPARDDTASDEPPGPTIFTALVQQLGLKLDPTRGSKEFLVIDRIEKPAEN